MGRNKIIFVTGATAGIGKATVELFAQNNWDVIITGRRQERLVELQTQLQEKYGIKVLSLNFDVRDLVQVQQQITNLPEEWRSIDVLLNNAGLGLGHGPFQEADINDWEVMLDTNVKGLLYMSRLISPLMIKNKKGHIINISSIAGKQVYAGGHVYCASKFAVDALCKAMRIDLLKYQIRVTSINPGMVETDFSLVRFKGNEEKASTMYDGYQALTAHDIADNVWYAATRPPHVNINEIIVTPTAQANAYHLVRDKDLA